MNIQIKRLLLSFISISISTSTYATVFDINCGDVSGFINSINTANSNSEADTINLNVDNQTNCVYLLSTASDDNINDSSGDSFGSSGLPSINSKITVNGNQATIRRAEGSEEFRLFYVGKFGDLTINDTILENGAALNNGFRAGGAIFNQQTLTLNNSTVSGNTAQLGGGIINFGATATLNNSIIIGNTATTGGGIFSEGTLTLLDSTVSGNTADSAGGIYAYGTLTMLNTTISDNTATKGAGGGINKQGGSTTITKNSTFSNNTATSGGAIFIASGHFEMGTAILTNNTIFGNHATQKGGGIYNSGSSVTFINNIIAGNTAPTQPDCQSVPGLVNQVPNEPVFNANNFNLFGGDGKDCNVGVNDLTLAGLGVTIDQVLNTTLSDNGGTTKTLALVPKSPAIDAADDTACPQTDQRGIERPFEGDGKAPPRCDIGAFEFNNTIPIDDSPQPPTLLIELDTLQAIATHQGIHLKWSTVAELDNVGFRFWRGVKDPNGNYTNVTLLDHPNPQTQVLTATPIENITSWSNLIPASGNLVQGHSYHYIDVNIPEVEVTYFYLLEDIDANGQSTFHWDNVVSATVVENVSEE